MSDEDRKVVQCNYTEGTSSVAEGARAYLKWTNRGNGNDRIPVLARSRSGRWIEKWEDIRRLSAFRVKTLSPEHPLYAYTDHRIWSGDVDTAQQVADELNASLEVALGTPDDGGVA